LEIGDWTLDVGYSGVTEEFQYPTSNTQYPRIKGRKEAATEHQETTTLPQSHCAAGRPIGRGCSVEKND
jgi:hypothetical protein